jgi:hypothetical protein
MSDSNVGSTSLARASASPHPPRAYITTGMQLVSTLGMPRRTDGSRADLDQEPLRSAAPIGQLIRVLIRSRPNIRKLHLADSPRLHQIPQALPYQSSVLSRLELLDMLHRRPRTEHDPLEELMAAAEPSLGIGRLLVEGERRGAVGARGAYGRWGRCREDSENAGIGREVRVRWQRILGG